MIFNSIFNTGIEIDRYLTDRDFRSGLLTLYTYIQTNYTS